MKLTEEHKKDILMQITLKGEIIFPDGVSIEDNWYRDVLVWVAQQGHMGVAEAILAKLSAEGADCNPMLVLNRNVLFSPK